MRRPLLLLSLLLLGHAMAFAQPNPAPPPGGPGGGGPGGGGPGGGGPGGGGPGGGPNRPPTLSVTGNAQVGGVPDRATVRLGAEAQGGDAMSAQNAVNVVMARALEKIRGVGIEDRRIQTSGLNLYPVYAQPKPGEDQQPRITGYRASNTVQVIVNDLKLVGRVIDAGIGAGANQLQGISFELENDLPQRTEALKNAVLEAKTKAEAIAGALGMRIQGIDEVNEGGVSVMPPQPMYGGAMLRTSMAATPVQAGEMQVNASVTIRYRLAPR